MELIVRAPVAAPAAVGVKTALNVALWLAVRVIGRVGPVKLNPVPDATALEMVTLSPPVLVTTTATDLLVPTLTLPKFSLLGLAVRAPAASAVPESGIDSGELEAFETMLNDPVAAPGLVGEKYAVKLTA